MQTVLLAIAALASISFLVWLGLVFARGWFWRTDQVLPLEPSALGPDAQWPEIAAVIPARNEADLLYQTLPSILTQDYPGKLHVYLVDDRSEDGTGTAARRVADDVGARDRLTVIEGRELPTGRTGKVWALQQGVTAAGSGPDYLWFTDADIAHPVDGLRKLVEKAISERLDLVSLMVRLRADTWLELLLIPAFVYFFAKLYPFRQVNSVRHRTAAAAGGCVVVRRAALEETGGLERMSGAIIDDCALAAQIKRSPVEGRPGGTIWLGHTRDSHSVRGYDGLSGVWNMVARTAYAQLEYSLVLLVFTVLAMLAVYAAPPLALATGIAGLVTGGETLLSAWTVAAGAAAWALMSASFVPMLRWYRVSVIRAPLLSVAGALYTAMTVASAVRHWRGRGAGWKGRTYRGG